MCRSNKTSANKHPPPPPNPGFFFFTTHMYLVTVQQINIYLFPVFVLAMNCFGQCGMSGVAFRAKQHDDCTRVVCSQLKVVLSPGQVSICSVFQ